MSWPWIRLSGLLPLLPVSPGCTPGEDRFDGRPGLVDTSSDETAPPDTGAGGTGPGDTAGSDTGDPLTSDRDLAVTWAVDLGRTWDCPEDYRDCTADYLAFPNRAAAWSRPVAAEALQASLDAIAAGQVPLEPADLAPAALAGIVREALNMDFLLDGLDERDLGVTVIRDLDLGTVREQHLLLDDPWVGEVYAILLLPTSTEADPLPAILPLHGHSQRAESVLDFMGGRQYPEEGYAVMAVTFRVMGADTYEDDVTRTLLEAGFTFEALRIYESLLALKLLRWHPRVDPDRLAVVGHSGSSAAWNLAIRLEPPAQAYVSDLTTDYYNVIGGLLVDETLPAVYPVHPALADLSTAGIPTLTVPYGYAEEMEGILEFLAGAL